MSALIKPNVAAVILARGGSKGLPGKNIKLLAGKPLMYYTIAPMKKCSFIDRIIVSTDDNEIASVAKKLGAEVPFIRPSELSKDLTTTEDSLAHAIEWLKEHQGYQVDILVFAQITDLFKKPEWFDQAVGTLIADQGIDSVFVADPTHKKYWVKKDDRFVRVTDGSYGPRQVKNPVYREDTGLCCATRARLIIDERKRLGDTVRIIDNDDFSIDVHSEFDLWLAEKLLAERPEFRQYLNP